MKTYTEKEQRLIAKKTLAANRYANCPEGVNKRRFNAIKASMEKRYMRESMASPYGLYSDSQIWSQTFSYMLK